MYLFNRTAYRNYIYVKRGWTLELFYKVYLLSVHVDGTTTIHLGTTLTMSTNVCSVCVVYIKRKQEVEVKDES